MKWNDFFVKSTLSVLLFFAYSCSHQTSQNSVVGESEKTSASRDIAQLGKAAQTVFAEIKLGSSILDDAVRANLDNLLRSETSLQALEKLSLSKPGAKYNSGNFTFAKNANGLDYTIYHNGKAVSRSTSLNFKAFSDLGSISKARNNYSVERNGVIEISFSEPGTSGGAEFIRFQKLDNSNLGKNTADVWNKKVSGSKNPDDAYLQNIEAELRKDGSFTEDEIRIMNSLKKLVQGSKLQALTNACGTLSNDSKKTLANILEDLAMEQNPNSLNQLIDSYAKSVGINNREEAAQIIEILRGINCGLNVNAFQ